MRQSVEFVCKRYKWGWSVWIKGDNFKKLLASKLKNEYDVYKYVFSIDHKGQYKVIER